MFVDRVGQRVEAVVEFIADRKAGCSQRMEQRIGLGGQQRAERLHGAVRLLHDRRSARIDQRGEGFARGRKADSDLFRRERQFFLELIVNAGDRGADAVGMIDDRFALGAEFVDEAAHAQFVIRIGTLQRIHFGMYERFEFRSARNGALDALIHRRDFAAHGLADRHDAFRRDGFRL